jgi:hypothetical protein
LQLSNPSVQPPAPQEGASSSRKLLHGSQVTGSPVLFIEEAKGLWWPSISMVEVCPEVTGLYFLDLNIGGDYILNICKMLYRCQ